MSLTNTPLADRVHIGIFGRRNAGKSSVLNAITGQSLAIVSDVKGTTTDPVLKSMELLPLGPVVMIDTPGIDDEGSLGSLRIQKTYQILNKTDIALLVVDGTVGMAHEDFQILTRIKEKRIPYLLVMNKADVATTSAHDTETMEKQSTEQIWVSAITGLHIHELKERIAGLVSTDIAAIPIIQDLLHTGDFVVLVVPIDSAAPKGRLILPQQQTIRDILEIGATAIVVQETQLPDTLQSLGKMPAFVITDSQVFSSVSKNTPPSIPLTSFSILFARHKGNLALVVQGAKAIDTLEEDDIILISEGCTHHRQCEDIGTVKLPRMLQKYTGHHLHFKFTSGTEFPTDLSTYKMIIHCGGCMLNEREMKYRLQCADDVAVPITNYGIAIAHMQGILERSIEPFTEHLVPTLDV
ncbi:MAG: [FeFe] hydrogenase H-cluster maturation GTPase HydF [Lachnospiraceae bacterium]